MQNIYLKSAAKAFNGIKPLRGELIGMGTSDPLGYPNIAPVGSMRVVDEETIHVLKAMLHRSMINLEQHPKAVFSVWKRLSVRQVLAASTPDSGSAPGYRIYATLLEESTDPALLEQEIAHVLKRIPWIARRPLKTFFQKNLRAVLRFSIDDVRPVS